MNSFALSQRRILLACSGVAVACACAYLALDVAAGCAADLKGGAHGDIEEAFQFEAYGLVFFLLALASGGVLAWMWPSGTAVRRVASLTAWLTVGGAALLLAGFQAQIWGIGAC